MATWMGSEKTSSRKVDQPEIALSENPVASHEKIIRLKSTPRSNKSSPRENSSWRRDSAIESQIRSREDEMDYA